MRTFIAIDLPDAARIELSKLIARLNREAAADVKWVEIENLHLTLKFIGHAAEPQIGEIKKILEKLTAAKKPFRVRLAGLGAFPNTRRPRVIWAGVEEGRKPLENLANEVISEVEKLRIEKELPPFQAHLTLGRVRSPIKIHQLADALEKTSFQSAAGFEVDRITYYRSTLSSERAVYEPIASFRFGAGGD